MGGIWSYMSNYCIDDFSVYNEFINYLMTLLFLPQLKFKAIENRIHLQ